MANQYPQAALVNLIEGELSHHFGKGWQECGETEVYKACALVVRDILMQKHQNTRKEIEGKEAKQVCYLSMEFLIGRSLKNHLFNLNLEDEFRKALASKGYDLSKIFEVETDAALGNGGLGRLAACYADSLATRGIPSTGFSILYEYGVFRQKILNGRQVELPDEWQDTGGYWLVPVLSDTMEIHFGGSLEERWKNGRLTILHRDYSTVLAVPFDMLISGYQSENVNALRLWRAKSPTTIDMSLFGRGEYVKAMEQKSMAEVISKVLYPEDTHYEGKSLRLKQQYFFVSATIQLIVRDHLERYKTLDNLSEKISVHINDTHPALAIPELMRILMDEHGLGWDDAWNTVTGTISYTNHTILSEALEHWPVSLFSGLLPRIYQIVAEINRRFCDFLHKKGVTPQEIGQMAIVAGDDVRMAHLCLCACKAVNGVSALHSEILKHNTFSDFYSVMGDKFLNVTNGIAHRRWLAQANPALAGLIAECVGSEAFFKEASALERFGPYGGDSAVRDRFAKIKRQNKEIVADYIRKNNGIEVDPASIFDVQAKRLHEYKRQLLNAMRIIHLTDRIRNEPGIDLLPRTFIFAAKASAGYKMAKQIIRLIHSIASEVNDDPLIGRYIRVVFLEDYRVSLAELLIPSAEISEQISVAGKEASGTGNMKFMLNGALTVGTLDGANIEIAQRVGRENIFIFGLTAEEAEKIRSNGQYNPMRYYQEDPAIKHVVDRLNSGIGKGTLRSTFPEIASSLVLGPQAVADRYLLLADFQSYCGASHRAQELYKHQADWNQKAILNVSRAGIFSADRSIDEYCRKIWDAKPIF